MVKYPNGIMNRICVPQDRVHKSAVIFGDKNRLELFRNIGTDYREFGEYLCWKSAEMKYDGDYFLLVCHGVGGSPAALAIRELIELGVKIIIRCGTCGTYDSSRHRVGDMCICYGAARGTSADYAEIDRAFPAVAHPDVVDALVDATDELGYDAQLGMSYSNDLFYRNGVRGVDERHMYAGCNIKIEESETAPLFILAQIHSIKAGAICTIDGAPLEWQQGNYDPKSTQMNEGKIKMCKIAALAAIRLSRQCKSS